MRGERIQLGTINKNKAQKSLFLFLYHYICLMHAVGKNYNYFANANNWLCGNVWIFLGHNSTVWLFLQQMRDDEEAGTLQLKT